MNEYEKVLKEANQDKNFDKKSEEIKKNNQVISDVKHFVQDCRQPSNGIDDVLKTPLNKTEVARQIHFNIASIATKEVNPELEVAIKTVKQTMNEDIKNNLSDYLLKSAAAFNRFSLLKAKTVTRQANQKVEIKWTSDN